MSFEIKIIKIKSLLKLLLEEYNEYLKTKNGSFHEIDTLVLKIMNEPVGEISDDFSNYYFNFIINNKNSINYLLINNYGNYVIQTLIKKFEIFDKNKFYKLKNILKENIIIINDIKLYNKWKNYLFT